MGCDGRCWPPAWPLRTGQLGGVKGNEGEDDEGDNEGDDGMEGTGGDGLQGDGRGDDAVADAPVGQFSDIETGESAAIVAIHSTIPTVTAHTTRILVDTGFAETDMGQGSICAAVGVHDGFAQGTTAVASDQIIVRIINDEGGGMARLSGGEA